MSAGTRYCADDLAKYPLILSDDVDLPQAVVRHCEWPVGPRVKNGPREIAVAEAIAQTSLVGYGGHLDEVIEDDTEGEVLRALADHLGPKFRLTWGEAYELLLQVRWEHSARVRAAIVAAEERWRLEGHPVERGSGPDACPTCGRKVGDYDDDGCETPDGQRWCVEHALRELDALRRLKRGAGA